MLKSKLKKKLPAINFLSKLNRQRDIHELLKPVKTLSFEQEDEENIDFNQEHWNGKNGGRFRKKYNENKRLVSKLTADYKIALQEMRKEMKESPAFLSESIDELKLIISNSTKAKAEDSSHAKVEDPIEIDEYMANRNTEAEPGDSTTWILLRANCEDRDYGGSSADYHQDENDVVLNRPQVEWSVLNKSVTKCQEWLDKIEIK